ncbi:MAG: LysE family transporter [Desulfobacteraceae bacterium]|nr:LysE family transporter [Desulfobacteraceae bacterium]
MELVHGLLLITVIHLLAAAAPGPDFVMVTQQTLSKGRKSGLLCSLGIALGLSVHIAYSAFGLATVIANSSAALWAIKILGGTYLAYMGIKGLLSKPRQSATPANGVAESSAVKTIATGFLCNALNPKAPLYFVSLFTLVLSPDMPLHVIAIYGIWIMLIQLAWFSIVATLLASPPVAKRFNRFGHYIDRALGGAMVALGIKVMMTRIT